MLKYFQHIRPSAILTILLGAALLRLPALYWLPESPPALNGVFLQDMFSAIAAQPVLSILLGYLAVVLQALILNRLCIMHDVLYVHTYMPAWLFVLANCVFPENLGFNPVMVSNFFVLGAMSFLFRLYQSDDSAILIFYAAFLFSLAAMFVTELLAAPLLILAVNIIFKNVSLRDLLAIATGALLPLGMIWGISWMAGQDFSFPVPKYNLRLRIDMSLLRYLSLVMLFLLSAAGLFKSSLNYLKNNIKTRRINLLFVSLLAFSLLIVLVRYTNIKIYYPLACIPLALFAGYFLLGNKGRRIKEFLHFTLLLLLIFSLYGNHLPSLL